MREGLRAAVWLAILVAGVAAAVYFAAGSADEVARGGAHDHGPGEVLRLVPVPLAQVTAITVVHRGEARNFLRGHDRRWQLHAHDHGHRSPGVASHAGSHRHDADLGPAAELAERIAEAFAMFGHTRIERVIATGLGNEGFGTADPEMIIALYRSGEAGPFRRILVGDLAPDGLARYVLLQEEISTVTIPNYQIENLVDLLSAVEASTHHHD